MVFQPYRQLDSPLPIRGKSDVCDRDRLFRQCFRYILPRGGQPLHGGLPAQQVQPAPQLRQDRKASSVRGQTKQHPLQQGVRPLTADHAAQSVRDIIAIFYSHFHLNVSPINRKNMDGKAAH